MKIPFQIFLFLFFLNCSSQKDEQFFENKKLNFIEFCNLPNHKNEMIVTEFYYSGFVEYWAIYGENKCELNNQTNLTFQNYNSLPTRFKIIFDKQKNYEILKIKAIGKFENDNPDGYGHDGINKSQFKLYKIINLKKVGKMKIKK